MKTYILKRDSHVLKGNGCSGSTSLDVFETSSHPVDSFRFSGDHRHLTLYCADCGYKHAVKLRCGSRTCSECRKKDYWRLLKGYEKAVRVMKTPKLLTLTLINKPGLSKEEVKRLRRCFVKLMRRKYYKARVRGGLYAIEIVNKGNGWNIHMHVLIDCDYLEQKRISSDWHALTGDSYVVDIRKAYSAKDGLRYILKYLSKPPQLNHDDNRHLYDAMLKGVRLVQPFGSLYRVLILEHRDLVCPQCGGVGWINEFEVEEGLKELGEVVKSEYG